MLRIRAFEPDDIPQVAALRRRVFERARRQGAELEAYLRTVFFANPWYDPSLPPRVSEEDGEITGFVGMVPRPFTRNGERLRAAVVTQIMVTPERRGLTGIALLRARERRPQDVLFSDVVTRDARRLWEGAGASAARLYGFHWVRPLRPARYAAGALGQAALARGTRFVAGPFFRVVDRIAAPAPVRTRPALVAEAMPDLAAIPALLPRTAAPRAVLPAYDADSLAWLLERARERWREEEVRAVMVRGGDGDPVGWFIYLDGGGGTALVLQMAALPTRRGEVLRQLFRHAWRAGATAVRGRADPRWMDDLAAAGVRWQRSGEGMVVHSRRPELLAAFLGGEAVLGALDGEWWMDF